MASENLFPDLHHKMSKKIAQLTKVIFHLNSRNEEHESDVKGLSDSYENEIDQVTPPPSGCHRPSLWLIISPILLHDSHLTPQILKEAAAKVTEFTKQIEIKKDEMRVTQAIEAPPPPVVLDSWRKSRGATRKSG
jgi:hypothetical protein